MIWFWDDALVVSAGASVPFTHYAAYEITIPAIDQRGVRELRIDAPIEIASLMTPGFSRKYLPRDSGVVVMGDGSTIPVTPSLLPLAFAGGGLFVVAYPNPLYDRPYTAAQAAEIERREALDW